MLNIEYPFVRKLIKDKNGNISQVILNFEDYEHLIELIEDENLYKAMQNSLAEKPMTLEQAISELENHN